MYLAPNGAQLVWTYQTLNRNNNNQIYNNEKEKELKNVLKIQFTQVSYYEEHSVFCCSCHAFSINLTKTKIFSLNHQLKVQTTGTYQDSLTDNSGLLRPLYM